MSKTTWWIIGVIVVIGIVVIIWSRTKGGVAPTEQPPVSSAIPETAPAPVLSTLSFSVEGLTTEDAQSKVEEAVKGVTGVSNVTTDLTTSTLTVEYDPASVTDAEAFKAEITKAIEGAGFKVKTETPAEPAPTGS